MRSQKIYFFVLALVILLPLLTNAQDKAINDVFTNYFAVKNDLTEDNYVSVKTHSTDLAAAIKSVPADKISAEHQAAWKKVQVATLRMGEAKDIDTQRDYFAVLSENILLIAGSLKVNNTPVYQQYCPMKKLNWLSEVAAIKNPYYGKQMLTCGQTVKTLAAAQK